VSPRPDGFVLAGGASSRMGADKATRSWRGAPLGLTLAELLGSACGSVSIVRRELADPGWTLADGRAVRVVRAEGGHDRHPLWGVAAGLRAATTPWAVLCATDLVGLCADDVAAVASAPGQVATRDGRWALLFSLAVDRAGEVEALAAAGAPVAALVAGLRGVPLRGHVVDANTPLDLSDA
jgi:molybdopterin-guanine dinucleotide biosynthesis protein A